MNVDTVCELCGEGTVSTLTQLLEYTYKGYTANLPSHYKQCDTCMSDYNGILESKANIKIIADFKHHIDTLVDTEHKPVV